MLVVPNPPHYQYEPLISPDHVRVLALRPAMNFDAKLKASIIQYDRTTMHMGLVPVYEAVSYTWGEPFMTHLVFVEGAQLPITRNVDIMLRHFRKPTKVRYLWVDAICLNQEDDVERTHQINRMGTIYHLSRKTRIWLGEADEDIPIIFGLFFSLSRVKTTHGNFFGLNNGAGYLNLLDKHTRLTAGAFNAFLSRPWFSRRWVLQEAVLNSFTSVQSGGFSIPWSCVSDSINILESMCKQKQLSTEDPLDRDSIYLDNFIQPRTNAVPLPQRTDLAEDFVKQLSLDASCREVMGIICRLRSRERAIDKLLWDFHLTQCTEPGDRLRALYGLADISPLVLDKIDANAQASWTVLYASLARHLIQQGQSWQLMSHIFAFGLLNSIDSSSPSYTPDWSAKRRRRSYLERFATQQQIMATPVRRTNDRSGYFFLGDTIPTHVYLDGHRVTALYVSNVSDHSTRTDALGPFLEVISHGIGCTLTGGNEPDRFVNTVQSVLRQLLEGRFGQENASSAKQTVFDLALEPTPDQDMERDSGPHDLQSAIDRGRDPSLEEVPSQMSGLRSDYRYRKAFALWLVETHGRDVQEQSPWIKFCAGVLHQLLQYHSFFLCGHTASQSPNIRPTFGFGPLDLHVSDVLLNFNAPHWTHNGISLGCVLRRVRTGREEILGARSDDCYRIVGPFYLLRSYTPRGDQPKSYHII